MYISSTRLRYLLEIYQINETKEVIRSADIAKFMGVRRPTVARMLQALVSEQLIAKERYGEVYLTARGYQVASSYAQTIERLKIILPSMGMQMDSNEINEAALAIACILPLPGDCKKE